MNFKLCIQRDKNILFLTTYIIQTLMLQSGNCNLFRMLLCIEKYMHLICRPKDVQIFYNMTCNKKQTNVNKDAQQLALANGLAGTPSFQNALNPPLPWGFSFSMRIIYNRIALNQTLGIDNIKIDVCIKYRPFYLKLTPTFWGILSDKTRSKFNASERTFDTNYSTKRTNTFHFIFYLSK